jgi:hypothetical protein
MVFLLVILEQSIKTGFTHTANGYLFHAFPREYVDAVLERLFAKQACGRFASSI